METGESNEEIRQIVREELQKLLEASERESESQGQTRREMLNLLALGVGSLGIGSYLASDSASAQTVAPSGTLGSASRPLEAMYSMDLQALDRLLVNEQQVLIDRPSSGAIQLLESEGTVQTGVTATEATHYVSLGVDPSSVSQDCEIAARLKYNNASGEYEIPIVEQTTGIGNPVINYDIMRVR